MSALPLPNPPFGIPQGEPGGAQPPAQHGFAGWFDRFMNPTNGLGQFGRALVMVGGTPLGDAYALMDKSKADSQAAGLDRAYKQAQIAHLGQGPEPTALQRNYEFLKSHDPALGEAYLNSEGDPIKVTAQQNPDGTTTLIPYRASQFGTSAAPGSLAPPQPAPSPLGAPEIAPSPAVGGMLGITASSESGNRDFNPDGSLVTSPKGAMGRMQVMPDTARDPGFGVRPAANGTPEELARVGRDYLGAMMARYKDPAKAWAAYNGGPNRLERRGGNINAMPAETRNYVAKNTKALGNSAQLLADAQAAIAKGADPVKVHARLRLLGVE